MHWLYRSLLFLGIFVLLSLGFVGLSRLGVFNSFEMTGGPPPGAMISASNEENEDGDTSAVQASTPSANTAQANSDTEPSFERPGGFERREGGFNWKELAKDLGYIVIAWIVVYALERTFRRPHKTA